MNCTIELGFCRYSRVPSVHLDLEDLSISTSCNELVSRYSLNGAHTQSAQIYAEYKLLRLDMESTHIARGSSRDQVVFLIFAELNADIVSHMSASVDNLREQLPSLWHQLPKCHLAGTRHGKLIVSCLTKLYVLDHAAPSNASWCLSEDAWHKGHLGNNMAVSHVPDEHLAVKCVACRHQEPVIVREGQV